MKIEGRQSQSGKKKIKWLGLAMSFEDQNFILVIRGFKKSIKHWQNKTK
jgi:hypothetical protein